MRVALVYDRVNKWGGAERVLLSLHEIFPKAPLYTSVYSPKKADWAKVFPKVIPSFLQKVPILNNHHELLGSLVPIAFETFDFSEYDLVISVTSEAAKGIITAPQTRHICYCLTPTRYLWSGHEYYKNSPPKKLRSIPLFNFVSRPFFGYTKSWDLIASKRPDEMIAISEEVKKRIKKHYKRNSKVIYPPVNIELFMDGKKYKRKDYYLMVTRLVPYKRVDLAIDAFNKLRLPLVIIGVGSEMGKLKKMSSDNISFKGFVDDNALVRYYKEAKAFIHTQDEDFGIAAVEAQAAGVPVIAYKKGGAKETVIDGKTGIFFERQTVSSLVDALNRFDRMNFRTINLVNNAKRFSKDRFKEEFKQLIGNGK
ncbi:glycosyltransferase [Patescibacteria group bacterium]